MVCNIYYFIDIVHVDHCTDTVEINFSCTPSIRVTMCLLWAKKLKTSFKGTNFELEWQVVYHHINGKQ